MRRLSSVPNVPSFPDSNVRRPSKVSVIRFPPNGLFGVSYFRAWRVLDQFCDQFATVGDFHRATAEASEGGF